VLCDFSNKFDVFVVVPYPWQVIFQKFLFGFFECFFTFVSVKNSGCDWWTNWICLILFRVGADCMYLGSWFRITFCFTTTWTLFIFFPLFLFFTVFWMAGILKGKNYKGIFFDFL
jgi:hypothetical protein